MTKITEGKETKVQVSLMLLPEEAAKVEKLKQKLNIRKNPQFVYQAIARWYAATFNEPFVHEKNL